MSYKPRISDRQLRELWLLKRCLGISIIELVHEAIDDYLVKFKREIELTQRHQRQQGVLR